MPITANSLGLFDDMFATGIWQKVMEAYRQIFYDYQLTCISVITVSSPPNSRIEHLSAVTFFLIFNPTQC